MTSGRAPSGPRLLGDDVQHLIAWYQAVSALSPGSDVIRIAVEAKAGNVDDLVVWRPTGTEYWQVKASIDMQGPASTEWLFESSRKSGSLLQRMYRSWKELGASGGPVSVVLATTKNIEPNDPVLAHRDRNNRIDVHLRQEKQAAELQRWAEHVGASTEDLLTFLGSLEIQTGISELDWKRKVVDISRAAGVREDRIADGVQTVRDWVKEPRHEFTAADLRQIMGRAKLWRETPVPVLAVSMIDEVRRSQEAVVHLDWREHVEGTDPRARRRLKSEVNVAVLRDELDQARLKCRDAGAYVEVRVAGRLPAWFLVGSQLGRTAGFELYASCGPALWCSDDPVVGDVALEVDATSDECSDDLVVIVNVSADITDDVREYVNEVLPHAALVALAPASGTSRTAVAHGGVAAGLSAAILEEMRGLRREHKPKRLHLFLAVPGALALFLGHSWDRLPPTQTYWDMNGTYEPAFLIEN